MIPVELFSRTSLQDCAAAMASGMAYGNHRRKPKQQAVSPEGQVLHDACREHGVEKLEHGMKLENHRQAVPDSTLARWFLWDYCVVRPEIFGVTNNQGMRPLLTPFRNAVLGWCQNPSVFNRQQVTETFDGHVLVNRGWSTDDNLHFLLTGGLYMGDTISQEKLCRHRYRLLFSLYMNGCLPQPPSLLRD